ncbi:MAG: hypothetical protein FWB73_01550, partial [Treponema sp.]|nr:hypothetical protein [Treponema sp.]
WNDRLNEKFLKMMKGSGESIKFTPEEIEKSRERYNNFEKIGEFEKQVREERAAAAKRPPVRLTF